MENKYFNKEEIFQLIAKERILSLVISIAIAFSLIGGSYYIMNEVIIKQDKDKLSTFLKNIDKDKIYRGVINLEKEVIEEKRESADGVKEGFDKYETSNKPSQSLGGNSNSNSFPNQISPNVSGGSSSGNIGNNSVGSTTNNNSGENTDENNWESVDNSSITGRNLKILEGQEFNPIKDLKLKATDINGKDITNRIIIVENDVDIYVPGQYIVKASVPLSNNSSKELLLTVNVEPIALSIKVNKFESLSEVVNKGESILINLDLNSNKDYVSVLSVNINNIDYAVNKIESKNKTQKYTVELPAEVESGVIDFKLESIRMSDNTVVEANKETKVIVEKEKPEVSNFTYEEANIDGNSRVSIKVGLVDKDYALIKGTTWLYLYDKNDKVVFSKSIVENSNNEIYYTATENGVYTAKIIGDLDLSGNTLKGEELFTEKIEVNSVNKTNLTGKNIKIKLGDNFDPIKDLNIKAIDVDGSDITEKVVIEENTVDINISGKYIVKALIINKNNEELRKEFTVEVIDSIIKRILRDISDDNINEYIEEIGFESHNISNSSYRSDLTNRSTSQTVSGNDSQIFNADVTMEGNILTSNGGAPSGKIEVELPTKAIFYVDKDGKFTGSNFNISNKSGCNIELSVANFIETNPAGGITIDNTIIDFSKIGRATVSLELQAAAEGKIKSINLDRTISNEKLVEVGAGNSATIHILGKAGIAASVEEDTNGATEGFILRFKIRKS